MARKRSSGKNKAFTPVAVFVIFLLVLLGVWIYFQQRAPLKSVKEVSEEKRVRELMQENPDAEVFKDADNEQKAKKKSLATHNQP